MAVADGIVVIACTPHILPGVYNNRGPQIAAAVSELQSELDREEIPLVLTTGADVHIAPDLVEGLRGGRVPTLGASRYFLLEPPQSIVPPRFADSVFDLVAAGYVPIITHPERLAWPEGEYGLFERIVRQGAWMQLTGGSLLGQFGQRAQALAERMLEDGLVHILASDAHNTDRRAPVLSEAFEAAADRIGEEEAFHLVSTRPAGILRNTEPSELPPPIRFAPPRQERRRRAWLAWN
jgi:protein-tyrosine phosphatase